MNALASPLILSLASRAAAGSGRAHSPQNQGSAAGGAETPKHAQQKVRGQRSQRKRSLPGSRQRTHTSRFGSCGGGGAPAPAPAPAPPAAAAAAREG